MTRWPEYLGLQYYCQKMQQFEWQVNKVAFSQQILGLLKNSAQWETFHFCVRNITFPFLEEQTPTFVILKENQKKKKAIVRKIV